MKYVDLLKKRLVLVVPAAALVVGGVVIAVTHDSNTNKTNKDSIVLNSNKSVEQRNPRATDTGTEHGYVTVPAPAQSTSPATTTPQTPTDTDPQTNPQSTDPQTPASAPTPYVTGYTKRFEDVDAKTRKQYCDYTYSDGSTQSVLVGTGSKNLSLSC